MALSLGRRRPRDRRGRGGRRPAAGRLQPPLLARLRRRARRDRRRPDRHAAADALADPRPRAGQPRRRAAVDDLPADPDPRLRHRCSGSTPAPRPVEVYAVADALVAPDFKDAGLLDTAVVVIRFDNGAIATAEANFSASYGYDVRGEVFGSAGMVSAGDTRQSSMTLHTADGGSRRPCAATSSCSPTPTRPSSSSSPPPCARAASPPSPAATPAARWRSPWPASSRSQTGGR